MFRNRVAGYIKVNDHSHRASVVGNVVFDVQVSRDSEDVLVAGNVTRRMLGRPGDQPALELPASLYLDGPPPFWGDRPWPAIGADVDGGQSDRRLWTPLPAEERHQGKE